MTPAERYRKTMEMKTPDRLVRREFGFMEGVLDQWREHGLGNDLVGEFSYDPDGAGQTAIGGLGWCEPEFFPGYETRVEREEGDYEIVRDNAGRLVKYFKGQRNGFMPTYLQHAVGTESDWDNEVGPRLDPSTPARIEKYEAEVKRVAAEVARTGNWLTQRVIGQYMYLRALMGPEDVMYVFFDNPRLVEKMLDSWVEMADAMIARLQRTVPMDEIFFGEDICYNHGLLISPELWRAFLKPRYLELLRRVQARQAKKIMIQIDTDGLVTEAIPLYLEIGMNIMSPFEVLPGNEVTELGKQYPELIMLGGIDKKVLAKGPAAIDAHLQSIIPAMVQRGGYIPTCDHMVPNEVSLENYRYYRKRMVELGG